MSVDQLCAKEARLLAKFLTERGAAIEELLRQKEIDQELWKAITGPIEFPRAVPVQKVFRRSDDTSASDVSVKYECSKED